MEMICKCGCGNFAVVGGASVLVLPGLKSEILGTRLRPSREVS